MAVILVTYDLKNPGRNYQPVWDYLNTFTHCRGLQSVWLLDTPLTTATICTALQRLVDRNDVVLAVRMTKDWVSTANYSGGAWLNSPVRNW